VWLSSWLRPSPFANIPLPCRSCSAEEFKLRLEVGMRPAAEQMMHSGMQSSRSFCSPHAVRAPEELLPLRALLRASQCSENLYSPMPCADSKGCLVISTTRAGDRCKARRWVYFFLQTAYRLFAPVNKAREREKTHMDLGSTVCFG